MKTNFVYPSREMTSQIMQKYCLLGRLVASLLYGLHSSKSKTDSHACINGITCIVMCKTYSEMYLMLCHYDPTTKNLCVLIVDY